MSRSDAPSLSHSILLLILLFLPPFLPPLLPLLPAPSFLPTIPHALQRLRDLLVLLIPPLVPLDVVFAGDLLDLAPQGVPFVDERLPALQVEAALRVELGLPPGDGQVEGGAVGDLAVVVEEPEVAAYQGGEADEVLLRFCKFFFFF